VQVPSSAKCPGDTEHHGYLVFSYVAKVSTDPSVIRYVDSYPDTGLDLVDIYGQPYITQATGADTASVNIKDIFDWSRYDNQPTYISPGATYNVGIACVLGRDPVRYWNTQFTFAASSSDPGGFTWTVAQASPSSRSHSLNPVTAAIIAAAVVAAAWIAVKAVLRRRRASSPAARA
jgi:hypothetical protein